MFETLGMIQPERKGQCIDNGGAGVRSAYKPRSLWSLSLSFSLMLDGDGDEEIIKSETVDVTL